jgi:hypothetical protein
MRQAIIIFFLSYLIIPHSYCQSLPISTFVFKQYSGGVMIVKANLKGIADSLNFILDTGSGGISLDSSTCSALNIQTQSTDSIIKGIGGVEKVNYLFDKTLLLGGLSIAHLNFHIYDYSLLSSIYGEKIDGVIGYSFFKRYIVKINSDKSVVEVYTPGKITYPSKGKLLQSKINTLPLSSINIKDKKAVTADFFLDTGAGLPFLMSEQFSIDSNMLSVKKKTFITQAEGLGGKNLMRLTVIKSLKIGPYLFNNVPTYLYKDDWNITSYPYSGGLIGNEILRRFNIILNYPANEIFITPNLHFNETFEYGYTGLTMYLIQDKILVGDVVKDSPAEKAGFILDDEIISVENNFSGNIQQYKNIIQEPDKQIKVMIKRADKLLQLELKTISIL